MKSTIIATVNRIDKSSISLSDVHSNGDWVSYSILIRVNPKKWQQKIRKGDTVKFEADLETYSRREFDGDRWDEVTRHRLLNPSKATIINPA